jgi:hypothetical protein
MTTMTATRRDLLKLASALGLAGTVPPTAERLAALSVLDQAASARAVLDPRQFADQLYGVLPGSATSDFDHDWYGAIAPVEHAAYRQAQQRIEAFFDNLGLRAFDRPGDYDATFCTFVQAMYQAGLRHGAAYEHLRRSVIGDLVQCRTCNGVGVPKEENTCISCGGIGTVAMKG